MGSVFPLRTTPFEEYLSADDRPGYRMTFLVDHAFEGEIDREAFTAGAAEALARHLLLNSVLERRGTRNYWVPSDVQPAIDWGQIDDPIRFSDDSRIDLSRETGLRLYVRVGRGQSRFIAEFHHACCDGFGATQFITDLFAGYVRRLTPHATWLPEFRPVDQSVLLRRHEVAANWDNLRELFHIYARVVRAAGDLTWNPPAPLAAPPISKDSTPLEFPATISRTLNSRIHTGLRKLAIQHDVTVHELLLRELLLTVRDWNDRHGTGEPSDRLSIMVPVNLRTRAHNQLPAANLIGYMSFYRLASECDDPAKLLDFIRAESSFMKRTRFASTIMSILAVSKFVPGIMNLVLNQSNCFASAVLSAVGDLSRAIAARYPVTSDGNPIAANLILRDISSAPPIRPLTRASFITWNVCNSQRLGVRCDPRVFSREGAQELLNLYHYRIAELTAVSTNESGIRREIMRDAA
jgi:hypothetical protein